MPDFSKRSDQKELLDRQDIPFKDIKRNMQELEAVNRWLGGHRVTLKGIKILMEEWGTLRSKDDTLIICEIGCGGGDNLKAIQRWASSKNIAIKFIGIDINKECIAYAKENCNALHAEWITSDYRLVQFEKKPDIIFSSLFCHHFTNEEVNSQFFWMQEKARLGFFVNDLHRHPLAYYFIKWFTQFFSRSYLVKNDAPLSVLRGFKKKELGSLINISRNKAICLEWYWAFRWLLTVKNEPREKI